ncbi:MAG: molybdenum cofactor biosynthesis protein A [Methanosaeta sp. PtaU1.Bin060]|nr:MAG: molybdenum cofactor biosynthesis protein A [Methanosaeta sp. PtaU1.Bin060]
MQITSADGCCDQECCLKSLVLWVTTDCNLRCRYCYARGGEERAYMDWPVARRAIDLMADQSDRFKVQFAGGEPLMNFDLIERIVSYSNDLGAKAGFQLQTNATLISPSLACRLRELDIRIGVSLDGLPKVNDVLRPFASERGSTGSVVSGLRNLAAAGIRVGLTCVLTSANIEGLPSLVELASYLGNVEGITLDPLRPVGRGKQLMAPSPTQASRYLKEAIVRAEEIAKIGGHNLKFREIERMRYIISRGLMRQHHCYFDACQSLMIKPNGDAYPCASLCQPEFGLGNILDNGFRGDLQDELMRTSGLIDRPHRCKKCPDRWLCGGPCPAGVFSSRDNLEIECAIKKVFIEHITEKVQ